MAVDPNVSACGGRGEILRRRRPLAHRLSVSDPLPEDHRGRLPVWSVVATGLD
ncbi:hypothetical protein BN971_03060 [Mycobacterium bohemicum DSM 44277]|uniref:Uncharacterized protein n=1 Tax=Mycobacterium bohemicum DSM 44277 TaxID=1236609 RepID=A0A0U0WB70_MYCBE|nr:hypothetical protein [Mycobacterium bohemicum]MCV6971901.1 hypothetical protein [Mycobacterium bohemicum]CPR11772.1 hypothetical protein BN971_03060 [Mycobacterium bohemicum DSM 44277]